MAGLRDKTILVVDDSQHMRTIVCQILKALPVRRVIEAGDGIEALERLRHDEVDAVILDYRMEPLDGVELISLVRNAKDSPAPNVPILMMTGHTEKSRVLAAREAGVTSFMAKPISARVLAERLLLAIDKAGYAPVKKTAAPAPVVVEADEDYFML
jgi:two-component system, chemotaxis family, chemotaxis protein CheY